MKYKILADEEYALDMNGIILHRIQALESFGDIKKDEIGGYVETYAYNLSQKGNCWIAGNAKVFGDAFISGNAFVSGSAVVSGNARIGGNAVVGGRAVVCGEDVVCGDTKLYGTHGIVSEDNK